jgi:transposase
MATIQSRMCRGHKYWYIVESKRINGKPRPVVIECLGSTEKLLHRLNNSNNDQKKIESFSHGAIGALLTLAKKLNVVEIINKYTCSQREYWAEKPLRNDLTAGITLLLAAIGRVCSPTSKRSWREWAEKTSLAHLLRISIGKIDSQHFWDLMDCIPEDAIEKIEEEILKNVFEQYPIEGGTLLYDTTNFYTFIDTTNDRCEIAQRGKNKQKRSNLRQVGLALAVTQEHHIPLLHKTYKGNMNDCKVFSSVISSIKKRMQSLNIDITQHTIVFDRGCNSKENLKKVKKLGLFYIGALTPAHHQDLISMAEGNFLPVEVNGKNLNVYRGKKEIWGAERTFLVFVSETLKEGQLRGVYQSLERKRRYLRRIQRGLANPRSKKRTKEKLQSIVDKLLGGQFMDGLISYELEETSDGRWTLSFQTNQKNLSDLEDRLGFRILMTNRHEWGSDKIIKGYYGQSIVENSFKNVKNPYHLAVTPEFHWTDQKIKVHFFTCVLGYLLSTLLLHEAKKNGFKGSLDTLLNSLNGIRLAQLIEYSGSKGRPKVIYKLEELTEEERILADQFKLSKIHQKPLKIDGVSVYTSKAV